MTMFERTIGVDYSGAETPDAGLPGLAVYEATASRAPREVRTPDPTARRWTRIAIAHWLRDTLSSGPPTLVGIDHGFSFPLEYFKRHNLPRDWPAFLVDFQKHWPTHEPNTYVDFIREGVKGNGLARRGDTKWRRFTERRTKGAKSVFHFDCTGSVAKSTHCGLPWLLFLRRNLPDKLHFWPFDGWDIPPGRSVIAEVYPALWKEAPVPDGLDSHQADAWRVAATLQRLVSDGSLARLLHPNLSPEEESAARIEGWILGVTGEEELRGAAPSTTRATRAESISAQTFSAVELALIERALRQALDGPTVRPVKDWTDDELEDIVHLHFKIMHAIKDRAAKRR